MLRLNCDAANKMVKQLQNDVNALLREEEATRIYSYGVDEKDKPEAPAYDFSATSQELERLQGRIRVIKHAINQFNVTTTLEGLGITIDEALVKMAMLSQRKQTLDHMRTMQAKVRISGGYRNSAEYCVRNFDPAPVKAAYEKISKELIQIQQALNLVNLTKEIEIPLDD